MTRSPRKPLAQRRNHRVLICDPHSLTSFALRQIVEQKLGYAVVAETGEPPVKAALARLRPSMILIDPTLRNNRLDLGILSDLICRAPNALVLLVTEALTSSQIEEALRLGVRGVVLKRASLHELPAATEAVECGQLWVSGFGQANEAGTIVSQLPSKVAEPERHKIPNRFGLSLREIQVVQGIVDGSANKEIGLRCGIVEETVKRHLTNIFDKVGVSTRLELAMFAIAHRLVADIRIAA